MTSEQSFISIIIPAVKSVQLTNTLLALSRQTSFGLIKEIIIVGQQVLPEYPSLKIIHNIRVDNRPTPAHNRNSGAQTASGSWLFFTDSDCLPQPNWIEQLATAITPFDMALAGAVDIPIGMSYWGKCDHYFGFSTTANGIAHRQTIPYAATLNFAIERSFFIELGGFNEAFQSAGGEDRELCWRITHRGVRIRFIPQAVVIHDHPRRDFASATKHIFNYGVVTGQFQIMQHKNMSIFRKIGMSIAKIPVLGELAGMMQVLIRALIRLFNKEYLQKLKYLPGIMYLDLCLSFGKIKGLRNRGNK